MIAASSGAGGYTALVEEDTSGIRFYSITIGAGGASKTGGVQSEQYSNFGKTGVAGDSGGSTTITNIATGNKVLQANGGSGGISIIYILTYTASILT